MLSKWRHFQKNRFAGASAYVRDSFDESMDVDPAIGSLANTPSVSIIEKHARIMRWLRSCNKPPSNTSPRSTRHAPPVVPPRPRQPPVPDRHPSQPPPVPPRMSSHQNISSSATKVSDVWQLGKLNSLYSSYRLFAFKVFIICQWSCFSFDN